MLNKTTLALAAALVLSTASAVLAADSGENDKGGAVMPGSTVGVNPVDHPNNPAVQSAKPLLQDNAVRTEGRAPKEMGRKDPQDPGPSDTKQ
jgi:hypothetical protein